jgi:hypothetical protein
MCKGIFQSGLQCQLSINAVVGIGSLAPKTAQTVNFILDTGSTGTMLSSIDAIRLDLFFDEEGVPSHNGTPLTQIPDNACGIGGGLRIFRLQNIFLTLISNENGLLERHTEFIDEICVSERDYQLESIMGMDFLKRFKLIVDPHDNSVNLTRIPLRGTSYHIEHS